MKDLLNSSVRWRRFGKQYGLYTQSGGSKVILNWGRSAIVTRDAEGILVPIHDEHPIAKAIETRWNFHDRLVAELRRLDPKSKLLVEIEFADDPEAEDDDQG